MSPGRASAGDALVERLTRIEREGGTGELRFGAKRLRVTSLGKPYFPEAGLTKGDLMRYYARMAPLILPVLRDRPLVLKRTPEGAGGEVFFQHKPPESAAGIARVATVDTEAGPQERIIGGDVATLLFLVQNGCISMDPWGSRVRSLDVADYAVLDLDPGPRAGFARVVEVALLLRDALAARGLHGVAKTSGSRGIHIVLSLPPRSGFDVAWSLTERLARDAAALRPELATVERSVQARAADAVYVDYMQNVRGKSVAAAYSARARPLATVSFPLTWRQVSARLDPAAFTIESAPALARRRDCPWSEALRRRNGARAVREAIG